MNQPLENNLTLGDHADPPAVPPPTGETPSGDQDLAAPAPEQAAADNLTPETGNDFEKMVEAYQQKTDVRKGQIVEGKIVKVQESNVLVDIGARCEGIFPIEEIKDAEGKLIFAEGDTIMVQVLGSTHSDYTIPLSYKNARQRDLLRQLKKHYQEGTPVEGTIFQSIKGGMKVDIQGLQAFLPASQIELGHVDNTDAYIGRKEQFLILKYNPKLSKLVVSRRALLEVDREKLKEELWGTIEVGKIIKGQITRLTEYGVFVDLGGLEGLIHISNLSWDKGQKPANLFKAGDEVEAQVIKIDREKERIGLGIKQMIEDPWLTVSQRYQVGQKVIGTVEKLESFGAFVKLEPGVTALIPISEMSWAKRIEHPSELLTVGNQVETVILRVDPQERKISLSLKQILPSPFQQFIANHHSGDILEGEVSNIVGYGVFVKLDEGVEGLLHISELSWLPVRNIDEFVKKGDRISVKVLHINKDDERISLSGKIGDSPDGEDERSSGESSRPPREDGPRRSGRRRSRETKEASDEHRYILDNAPASASKLGERFPQSLLDKMKPKKEKE